MRIFYDHQIFSYQRFGGISRYFTEIMTEFSKNQNVEFDLGVKYSQNEHLLSTALLKKQPTPKILNYSSQGQLLYSYMANKNVSNKLLSENNYDIIHPTFYDPYFFKRKKDAKIVITIHDMTPEKFPHLFKKNSLYNKIVTQKWINEKKKNVALADLIITVSEKTKNDLVDIFKINPEKVFVVHLGNSLIPEPTDKNTMNVEGDYFLFVGARGDYKNFELLLKAYSVMGSKSLRPKLICVGGGAFTTSELNKIKRHGLEKCISQRNATDAELIRLYKNAIAFIYPSLYEGFGIPILEAFACNCPVLLSNASCFPEIAGDAGLYFDPVDVESLSKSLSLVKTDLTLRDSLIKKGSVRLKNYSWRLCAEKTSELYQKLLKGNL